MAPIAPLKIIVAPAAKAIAKIGSTMTYDDVPCIVDERNDSCPTGHVPPTLRLNSPLISSSTTASITFTIAAVILAQFVNSEATPV